MPLALVLWKPGRVWMRGHEIFDSGRGGRLSDVLIDCSGIGFEVFVVLWWRAVHGGPEPV
ncbi:hypothetical protein CCB80_09430 [Armatimonadetes bacterium Uphvl-Ar1]|nr:hypothetical protein CCB80_09430 [Armatimonadetes bacterium Uphvl-Ar1]